MPHPGQEQMRPKRGGGSRENRRRSRWAITGLPAADWLPRREVLFTATVYYTMETAEWCQREVLHGL